MVTMLGDADAVTFGDFLAAAKNFCDGHTVQSSFVIYKKSLSSNIAHENVRIFSINAFLAGFQAGNRVFAFSKLVHTEIFRKLMYVDVNDVWYNCIS